MTSQTSSSATTHKIYLILWRTSKAFYWRQNRFEILQHFKKLKGGSINPLLYHGGVGMTLRVRPRVKIFSRKCDKVCSLVKRFIHNGSKDWKWFDTLVTLAKRYDSLILNSIGNSIFHSLHRLRALKVFRYSFLEAIPIFFSRFKSNFILVLSQ